MARAPKKTAAANAAPRSDRDRIVDALMELAAEQAFGDVTISAVAEVVWQLERLQQERAMERKRNTLAQTGQADL